MNTAVPPTGAAINKERQYYLDWIRIMTILIVFLFHGGRFFDSDDWHIKNGISSPITDYILFLSKEWMMPVFFFISGASTWFALSYKSSGRFAADRVRRIFIPLLFGIFILSPPQVYLERIAHHQFSGSLGAFIPHYFSGWYGFGGNFAWMGLHLWYLLLLFLFSFIALPLFSWWKGRAQQTVRVSPFLIFSGFVVLLALPGMLLPLDNLLVNRSFGGWGIIEHLVVFITGYYAFARLKISQGTIRFRYHFLVITLIATGINSYLFLNHMLYEFGTPGYYFKIIWRSFVCFAWIFTILGFAADKLNYSNNFLQYGNEAVLPFYIAHQPIMLLTGYFIVGSATTPFIKYLLIVAVSFLLVMLCYQFIIRKLNGLRYLFGMPQIKK